MKLKVVFSILIAAFFFAIACEKEAVNSIPEIDDEVLALVEEEVLADINFANLLDEGDDGLFWGDPGFSTLKSVEIELNNCRERTDTVIGNERIVTLEFNGNCEKTGTIVIVYHKNGNNKSNGEKTISYINFKNANGTISNGVKIIKRGNDNHNIKSEMLIAKENKDGDSVFIARNYERQVHWICGLETRKNSDDNVKKVTGKSEITRTVNGETKSYSRKILSPLLIVKACGLKIQAGTVKVEKPNGTKVTIDYGEMPEEIECGDTPWENCNTIIEVSKGDDTFTVEFDENGKKIS